MVDYKGKPTGFRASSAARFADKMREILELPDKELEMIRRNAREHVKANFSAGAFDAKFLECLLGSKS